MEENMNMNEEEHVTDQAKAWLQENLRVIVSFLIVAAIALGIYSYSQRSNETVSTSDDTTTASDTGTLSGDKATDVKSANGQSKVTTTPTELSRETETSFVETATKGDGTTHLARRALMNYLEKTPDSSLSGEHKVYIEDYLRKQLTQRGPLAIGQSAEFSKDMIRQAIDQSKQLNGKQLQNLKKYSSRVAAYRS
ncbi:MAG: hypothetical protein WBP40_05460 [Candidatus Moraniibacteriota bacterium]|nr:MAG: hypothetical protein IPJ68_04655 [Candidatus Moranbacteria bacterium]